MAELFMLIKFFQVGQKIRTDFRVMPIILTLPPVVLLPREVAPIFGFVLQAVVLPRNQLDFSPGQVMYVAIM